MVNIIDKIELNNYLDEIPVVIINSITRKNT